MKIRYLLITSLLASVAAVAEVRAADDDKNYEIIAKAMKDGLKGDDSPLKKVLEKRASAEETKTLVELIHSLKGTQAPVGDQKAYEDKVAALIAAADKVGGGDASDAALAALKKASNCKACHNDHKPKD